LRFEISEAHKSKEMRVVDVKVDTWHPIYNSIRKERRKRSEELDKISIVDR
jgi:hypothetical protein